MPNPHLAGNHAGNVGNPVGNPLIGSIESLLFERLGRPPDGPPPVSGLSASRKAISCESGGPRGCLHKRPRPKKVLLSKTTTSPSSPNRPQKAPNMLPGGSQLNSDEQRQKQQRDAERQEYVTKQQRWLLFLMHCSECQAPEGHCQYSPACNTAKALLCHIRTCSNSQCLYPRCATSRDLLKHHQRCTTSECPVCTPVNQYVTKQRTAVLLQQRTVIDRLQQLTIIDPLQQRTVIAPLQQRTVIAPLQQHAVIAPDQGLPQIYPNLKAAFTNAQAALSNWGAALQKGPAQRHVDLEAVRYLDAARFEVEAALSKVEAEQAAVGPGGLQQLAQLRSALEAARSHAEAAVSQLEAGQSNLDPVLAGLEAALSNLKLADAPSGTNA